MQFEICIDFGETELTARIRWKSGVSCTPFYSWQRDSNGIHQQEQYVYGPATITYLSLPPEIVDTPPSYNDY
jgi:hypothetical protein